jgi:hypothetical protein
MDFKLSIPNGIYHDQIITGQGQVIDLGWKSNIIVDRCRQLLASFMKGDPSSGIQLLKVGIGMESWDEDPPGPPTRTIQQLTDPSPADISINSDQIVYLNAAGDPTEDPTNRLSIAVTLESGTPPIANGETSYPLREFGLFGIYDGDEFMIDYVRHPVIHKQADDTITRTIRLIF